MVRVSGFLSNKIYFKDYILKITIIKIMIFFAISFTLLAAEINVKEFKEKYLLGVETFKKKEYQKSLEIFEELFEIKSDEPDVNFYMGRAAFELKDYEGALIAYDRVLIVSPNSLRTQLEVARTYFLLKSYDRSKNAFKEILKIKKVPGAVQANVNRYLDVIAKAQQKHIVTGIVMLSLTSESNLDNRAGTATYNVPAVGNLPNSVVNANDLTTQQIVLVNHKFNKSDEELFKNDMMLFNKAYKEFGNHNILLANFTPTYSKVYNEKLTVDYSLFYDYLVYASNHLLDSYGINPKLQYNVDKENTLKIGYKLTRKNNIETGKNKDSNTHQISIDLVKKLNDQNSITPSFKYSMERKKSYELQTIDNDTYKFALSHSHTYSKKIFFTSALSYELKNYKEVDSLYFKRKENKKTDLSLTASYLTDDFWIVQGAFTYSEQESSFEKDNYDKNTFAINFVKPF